MNGWFNCYAFVPEWREELMAVIEKRVELRFHYNNIRHLWPTEDGGLQLYLTGGKGYKVYCEYEEVAKWLQGTVALAY